MMNRRSLVLALCLAADPTIPLSVDAERAEKGTVKSGPALKHAFMLHLQRDI